VMVLAFLETECRAEASSPAGLQLETVLSLFSTIIRIFQHLPTATTIVNERRHGSVAPRCRGVGDAEKKCVTFSIVQLLKLMLTESRTIRQAVIKSSEEWKTGDLYNQVPEVYGDVIHGSRFRSSDMCKKATPSQKKHLRVAMHPWNDAFTSVDGMKQKAAENKWEVVLVCLLNLPLFMRHYFDHILLVAIAQAKWAAANGGITRILCGVGKDGKQLDTPSDAINLFSEIRASKEGKITINLPDDENPSNEAGIDYILILGITCISLDWLANGAFGPFAESVSAHRPCFKCMWTPECGCAWIARTDERNSTISHTARCAAADVLGITQRPCESCAKCAS
jgi:hypothetical protein